MGDRTAYKYVHEYMHNSIPAQAWTCIYIVVVVVVVCVELGSQDEYNIMRAHNII